MDSQRSDPACDRGLSRYPEIAAAAAEAVRRGDWHLSSRLSALLAAEMPPADEEELRRCLTILRDAVLTARIGRTHLAATRNRIRAAAGFCASAR